MKTSLLFDFTVTNKQKRYCKTGNWMPAFRWYGMLLPNKKFLTNGGHLNPGIKNKFMILKLVAKILCYGKPRRTEHWSIQNLLPLVQNQLQNVECFAEKMKT